MFKLICRVSKLLLKVVLLDLSELTVLDLEVPHEQVQARPLLIFILFVQESICLLLKFQPIQLLLLGLNFFSYFVYARVLLCNTTQIMPQLCLLFELRHGFDLRVDRHQALVLLNDLVCIVIQLL